MGFWRRRQSPALDQAVVELLSDCEAFLRGRYPLCEACIDASTPCWTWLATLVHGSEERLQSLLDRSGEEVTPDVLPWWRAMRTLAMIILRRVEDSKEDLLSLQRRALVPLELQLMGSRYGPATMVREVMGALSRASDRA